MTDNDIKLQLVHISTSIQQLSKDIQQLKSISAEKYIPPYTLQGTDKTENKAVVININNTPQQEIRDKDMIDVLEELYDAMNTFNNHSVIHLSNTFKLAVKIDSSLFVIKMGKIEIDIRTIKYSIIALILIISIGLLIGLIIL